MTEPLFDSTFHEVPDDLRYLWDGAAPIELMLWDVSIIAMALKTAMNNRETQFQEVNLVDAIACATQLKAQLARAIPYAVCPACQGKLRKTCMLCKGRGAISKFLWNSPAVTEGLKRLRKTI